MFSKHPQNHGTSVPQETPFQRAAREWDDRIGSAREQARNWRVFAFSMLAVNAGLAIGLVHEADRTHVQTAVIAVNKLGETGRIIFPGNHYNPTEAEIGAFLKRWLRHMFSEPTDPVVFSQNIHSAYAHLAGNAATYVSNWAQKHPPNKELGTRAVSIQIDSILPRSRTTFQVTWRRQIFKHGALQKTESYTGLFTVSVHTPANETAVRQNPLGLYITDASWSRQF